MQKRLAEFTRLFSEINEEEAFVVKKIFERAKSEGKIIFIGNGGSASIASHMAEDYTKNGHMRAIAFNDAALITCFANDCGFENFFAEAISHYADPFDILVAISSSGQSLNILNAVTVAKQRKCKVITLSGFSPENPLKRMGDVNLHVNADQYGFVEITHLTILHTILDMICEEK